ncbi:MAG: GGDEF domain-containing protein [Oscillospiraceae bacterium]|nr:GGDEF domain-containing protein [Oscillospiraceae bacterium]
MSYASIGLLAALVLIIINKDILRNRSGGRDIPAQKAYRRFLFGILAYYVTDVLWGLLDARKLMGLLYADTVIYFAVMAVAVLFWTQFVVGYLDEKSALTMILHHAGRGFLVFELVVLAVNFFRPVLFRFDENGEYQAFFARHLTLVFQILMFLLTWFATLLIRTRRGEAVRIRYRTIGLFGLAMAALIGIQIAFPLLPLYSVGYLLGSCLLHSFVIEGEKAEYRRELEESLQREQRQKSELGTARHLAYTDSLTGIRNKLAYLEKETQMEERIAAGTLAEFAAAMFDLNGLKLVNDTQGHEAGNRLIIQACRMICEHFKHSPVFRIGGDEFAAILEGQDYQNRAAILAAFNGQVEENQRSGQAVVAAGMAEFAPGQDDSFQVVFERADREMYLRKKELKEMK